MTTQRNINQTRFLIQVPATGSKGYDSRLRVRVQAASTPTSATHICFIPPPILLPTMAKPITNQNERRIVAKEKREQDLVRGLKGVKLASSLLPGRKLDPPRPSTLNADSSPHSLARVSPPLQEGPSSPLRTNFGVHHPRQNSLHIDPVWN
ncbi:hypothetical protein F2Q70_00001787 [Brassica cretica]|uniref:Uncharacterized protein n=2 Tax=Brassica cretica TaxID=69181 RepID=A0A3N6RYN5_BRACR|nr:hypothetical protein F2Q68_00019823 [Brassica cretica]KAF2576378.1 hypothetical protein F2Q70_00001787 [Brassica cretica]KAF3569370.1 hypothetical protein DY000_02012925 [Brassica cretica]